MRAVPVLALTLAGCQVAAPTGGATGGDTVPGLSPGMTPAQAQAALGPDTGYERNPADWDETCISHADPRGGMVHAVFRGGALVRATGGHGTICTYPDTWPD